MVVQSCDPSTLDIETEGQEFKVNLDYIRPCLKEAKHAEGNRSVDKDIAVHS